MNKKIVKQWFPEALNRIEHGRCANCGRELNIATEFKDELSKKEYKISGLCQKCQDKVFK